MRVSKYDFLVIGGGLFGCYASLYLARQGQRVLLLEKDRELMKRASIVNQARLHRGYHYPRSVATALMSEDHRKRFSREHEAFINRAFEQYYAIDRYASFTDRAQYERFCQHIGLPWRRIHHHPAFNFSRIEALYATEEYTFDPPMLAAYYRQLIEENNCISIMTSSWAIAAEPAGEEWQVQIHTEGATKERLSVRATQVLNATYAASNAVHRLFGLGELELMHEIAEMAFVRASNIQPLGLTVMDGPFTSLMPYGHSGVLSLSSVAYTHHKVSYQPLPTFDCQEEHPTCRPDLTDNCNPCPLRPSSHQHKMIAQIRQYFQSSVDFQYVSSMFTIKSKLRSNYIDDGRPTELALMHKNPRFYCIFAGKINSIYEIEKILD